MAIPTLLSNLTTGAKTAMNTVQTKKPVTPTQWLAKKELSNLTNVAKTSAQTVQWGGDLLNKTVGIAKQSKANVINKEHESTTQSLADFVATTQAKWTISNNDIQTKFPEFKGKEQAVADFVTTIQAKPDITPEEIKVKFPELYPTYEPEPTLWEKASSTLWWLTKSVVGLPWMVAESGILDKPVEEFAKSSVYNLNPVTAIAKKASDKLWLWLPDKSVAWAIQSVIPKEELQKYQAKQWNKPFSQVAKENYAWDVSSKEFKKWEQAWDIIQLWVAWATWLKSLAKNAPTIIQEGKRIVSKWKSLVEWAKSIVKNRWLAKKEWELLDLIQPKLTPTVEAERAAKWLKKTNWYGKVSMWATKKEKEMVNLWKEILDPWTTITTNVNNTIKALDWETDNLIKVVEKNPTIFNPKEITSRMRKIEKPLMIRWWENEAKYDAIINKFEEILKWEKKNTAWLLKARKKLDSWINAEIPNLYTSDTMSPLKVAVSKIRKIPNEWINEKIWGDIVKNSLSKQSLMMDMIENMAWKTEKTWSTSVSRFLKKHQWKLGLVGAAAAGNTIANLLD